MAITRPPVKLLMARCKVDWTQALSGPALAAKEPQEALRRSGSG